MILADTSVWIDHLRKTDPQMVSRLDSDLILMHPLVLGEIAVGSLRDRSRLLSRLDRLPRAKLARHYLVLQLIEGHRLYSRGLSYIDVSLLASARLTPEAQLWTRDNDLADAARQLDVGVFSS